MAPRRKQMHIYDPATISALKSISLPDKIKCYRCQKNKSQANFSQKQLTDARLAIKNGGHSARYSINCNTCSSGQQLVEIECVMCHKTKGLEAFAKAQRKKPDSAKCYSCIEDQLAQEAIQEEIYESDDRSRAFAPIQTSDGANPDVWTESTETEPSEVDEEWKEKQSMDDEDGGVVLYSDFARKMSLSTAGSGTLIESEYDHTSELNDDGWMAVQNTKSWHTKSANSTSSGFDPNEYGKHSIRSSNPTGSLHTFISGCTERSSATVTKTGWAKIKAYDPKKDLDRQPASNPAQDDWSSESESENEDDDEDDSDEELEI